MLGPQQVWFNRMNNQAPNKVIWTAFSTVQTVAGTFARQLGWVFVGPCHPSVHGPPAMEIFCGSLFGTEFDTHTWPLWLSCYTLRDDWSGRRMASEDNDGEQR